MKKLIHTTVLLVLAALSDVALGQTVTYFHTDALGTPIAITDAAGNVIETSEYAPYGDLLNRPDSDGPGYTGHVQDAATGLTYMQQRYFDPQIGRFLSVDPVAAYSNPVGAFNRYRYAANNPYRFTDPDGRQEATAAGAAIGCAVTGPGCPAGAAAGAAIGAMVDVAVVIGGGIIIYHATVGDSKTQSSPSLPEGLVGTEDEKSGRQGDRINNGPLSPEHGGTGDDEKDFETLTGGKYGPAPSDKGYPEGTRVGENEISHRPASGKDGPRIDIPANSSKPHETLHYPKPPPPPDPRPQNQ